MLSRADLHHYQNHAVDFAIERKKCGLFIDMGLGKTVITLTALKDMLLRGDVRRVLIVAPLRVANNVWKQEAAKWGHLRDLDIRVCTGSARKRLDALQSQADIHVINRENVPWLIKKARFWKWDALVVDESSSFKAHRTARFRAIVDILEFLEVTILLTGTPSPNSLLDLWPQVFLMDRGERLGKDFYRFRQRYFDQGGYGGYEWFVKPWGQREIYRKLSEISLRMDAKDWLEVPPKIDLTETVEMPPEARRKYRDMEKNFFVELNEVGISAYRKDRMTGLMEKNFRVRANKLLQMCNGTIYDADGNVQHVHDAKIHALRDILEDNPNENFLVAYNFRTDLDRLKKAFPYARTLSTGVAELEAWNRGEIRLLLAHPQSAGHGLNLQEGGSIIVWFGLNWSLELYEQFNARLHRQGQTRPVRIMHLVTKNALDHKIMTALNRKATNQNELLNHLRQEIHNGKSVHDKGDSSVPGRAQSGARRARDGTDRGYVATASEARHQSLQLQDSPNPYRIHDAQQLEAG